MERGGWDDDEETTRRRRDEEMGFAGFEEDEEEDEEDGDGEQGNMGRAASVRTFCAHLIAAASLVCFLQISVASPKSPLEWSTFT